MSVAFQGVIEQATGDLLRYGYVDFGNSAGFDSETEEVKTNLPEAPQRKGDSMFDKFHRWNGSAWVLVDQP